MRILTVILAVLCLIACAGLGGMMFAEYSKRAAADVELAEKVSAAVAKEGVTSPELAAEMKKLSAAKRSIYIWAGLAALSLVLLVLVFVNKGVLPVGAVVAIVGVLAIVLVPDEENFKTAGLLIGGPGLLGAVFAILSDRLRQKNAAA